MKHCLFYILFLFAFGVSAQDIVSMGHQRSAENAQLRQVVLHIDGLDFDYRVLKYYPPNVLQALPAAKRIQVHFLYTASYEVLNSSSCSAFDPLDIDIAALDIYRGQQSPVVVEVGEPCKVQVRLMSRLDCQLKMEELVK